MSGKRFSDGLILLETVERRSQFDKFIEVPLLSKLGSGAP